jgi:hypothetical protein
MAKVFDLETFVSVGLAFLVVMVIYGITSSKLNEAGEKMFNKG